MAEEPKSGSRKKLRRNLPKTAENDSSSGADTSRKPSLGKT